MEKKDPNSKVVRYTLFLAYDKTCFYCHEPLANFADIQIDHFIPEHPEKPLQSIIEECNLPAFFKLNSYYNLTPMHPGCNNRKRARLSDRTTIRMALFDIKRQIPKIEQVEGDLIKSLKNSEGQQQLETLIEKGLIFPKDLLKYIKPESQPKETTKKDLPKQDIIFDENYRDFEIIGIPYPQEMAKEAIPSQSSSKIMYGTASQIFEGISSPFTEFQVLMYQQNFKQVFARWDKFELLFQNNAFSPPKIIDSVGGSSTIPVNYKFGKAGLQLVYNGQSFAAIVILGDEQVPHTDPTFPKKLEEFFNEIKNFVNKQ